MSVVDIDPLSLAVDTTYIDCNKKEDTTGAWEHEELAQVRIKVLRGHTEAVNSCQYIADDSKILTSSDDLTVKIWSVEEGKILKSYDTAHAVKISEARINHDNTRFVTSGWDKSVKVWDVETGSVLWTGTHDGMVNCCQYSHDGKLVLSGSDSENAICVWDSHEGKVIRKINNYHASTLTKCIFAPNDDKAITTSMDRSCKFLDLKTWKCTIRLGHHINVISSCDVSFDERKFATVSWDKTVDLWDIATGGYRSKGPSSLEGSHEGSLSSCQFSGDGEMLVTGSYDRTIVVWDIENEVQKLKLQGHTDWVEDVTFSKDQNWLLSCSRDKTVRMWSIQESDTLPVVLEKRKAIGLQILKCSECGKPFSMSQLESFRDVRLCVFCRLQDTNRNIFSVEDEENIDPEKNDDNYIDIQKDMS
ncbi:hypothetical protein ScPMuIL_000398 [Solemya velum]